MAVTGDAKQAKIFLGRLKSGYRDQITLYRTLLKIAQKENPAIRDGVTKEYLSKLATCRSNTLKAIDRIDLKLRESKRWVTKMRPHLKSAATSGFIKPFNYTVFFWYI